MLVLIRIGASAEPAREMIVYTALRPANWDLYLFEAPGQTPKRLTTHPGMDYNAVFSPDGRWIVFCSERGGNPDLYALDLHRPGPPRPLTSSQALEDAPTFSPDGRSLAFVSTWDGHADICLMPFRPEGPEATEEAVNLTRDPGGDFNPAFSPDGRQIAFSSDRDGYRASEIYVMQADGSNPRRLTRAPGWDGSPSWSPDGQVIYFYSERDEGQHIYRMNADGSDPRPVTLSETPAVSPAPSPGGRVAFAVEQDGQWQIVSLALDGSDKRLESDTQWNYWAPAFNPHSGRMVCHGSAPLGDKPQFGSRTPGTFLIDNSTVVKMPDRVVNVCAVRGYFPSINPAGTHVACDESFDRIVSCRLDGSGLRTVFSRPGASVWRPSWSRDGQWIACTVGPTFAAPDARADIWKFRPDGSEAVNLTNSSESNDAFPDFSPDGRQIVFRSGRDGNHEIYLMNSDGTGLRRLTHHETTDTMPAFSPSGDQIAFTSNRDGDYEVYTMRLGERRTPVEPSRLTSSRGRDTHPKFSPDGRWLVFASERGGVNDEEPLIPVFNPQPYGDIYAVRLEDRLVVRLTHNKWEDGTPTWSRVQEN